MTEQDFRYQLNKIRQDINNSQLATLDYNLRDTLDKLVLIIDDLVDEVYNPAIQFKRDLNNTLSESND